MAALASAAIAGCGSAQGGPSATRSGSTAGVRSSTAAATATTATRTMVPAGTTATAGARTTTDTTTSVNAAEATAAAECTTSQLRASLSSGGVGLGTAAYDLKLTNRSSAACWEQGYAGVSLTRSGTDPGGATVQIGAAAKRIAGAEPLVTLAPGETAYARVGVTNAANYPVARCKPETSDDLKVYPPNQTAALELKLDATGCSGRATSILLIGAFGPTAKSVSTQP